jgi:hypothetical protein
MTVIKGSDITIRFVPKRSERLLLEAALRWHRNRQAIKRAVAGLETCTKRASNRYEPCYRFAYKEDWCDACLRNEDRAPEIRTLRAQRGAYTATLARMAGRVEAERLG